MDGLVQDCSISSVLAMELLQSCTKPSIWHWYKIRDPHIPLLDQVKMPVWEVAFGNVYF